MDVVFFPMHHIGTELFYNDVSEKVDSLQRIGYFVYWEKVHSEEKDTILRKYRKITGVPSYKSGYKNLIDSILGKNSIKLKKKIINQPSYWDLGVDSVKSKNVDATLSQMVTYYENKYGIVQLKKCDFETSPYEETSCKDNKVKKELRDDFIVYYRNTIVLREIDNETRNKIAIIYGENHLQGMGKGLIERGFSMKENK